MISIGTDCSGMETPVMALQQLGVRIDHQFACDVNKFAKATIMANYAPKTWYDDLTTRDNRKAAHVDLYVAGFPCQPFSMAGMGQGFDDSKGRGTIFWKVREYIKVCKPKIFVLENVKGLVNRNNGEYLSAIMESLNALGTYNVDFKVLNTQDHGVPHHRERLYLVGILKSCDKGTFEWPQSLPRASIDKFLEPKKRPVTPADLPPRTTAKCLGRCGAEGNARFNVKQVIRRLQKLGHDPLREPWLIDCDSSPYRCKSMFNSTPCITCRRGNGHWVSNRGRRLTKDEQMRLQGMDPKGFKVAVSDSQLGIQIGNSMSVNVLERIFVRLLPAAGLCVNRLRDRWAAENELGPAPATPPRKRKNISPPRSPVKARRIGATKTGRDARPSKA